ncbi:MAG: SDR family oxidoreductase [Candidatus Krumholzibacteria bacterium]|nr:SDR family oxidoreductase [Candidatus Krumholzibacteria bacterium]
MRWVMALLLALSFGGAAVAAEELAWEGQTVLVTGANRGLGLEFARQLQAAGATVIGTARKPEKAEELKALGVRVEQLDVADPASVAALAERLDGAPLDVLLNNAGIFLERGDFESADPEAAMKVYNVNTVGPMRVTQALLPNLRLGQRKLIMNMSSGLGSIGNNDRGAFVSYRASKAALNMQTRTQAVELAKENFICIAMSPGWVRTDMGGENASLSPAESVSGMLGVLAPLTVEDSGRYLNHDGNELPW